MRHTLRALALASACGLAAAVPARANWVYDFTGTTGPGFGIPNFEPYVRLEITDAAEQAGSFNLRGYGGPFPIGPGTGFVSFQTSGLTGPLTATGGPLYNGFNVAMLFNEDGSIASDTVSWNGPDDDGNLSGNQALSSGTFSSDYPGCGSEHAGGLCGTISGSWTSTNTDPVSPVPEPASFALLGAGIIGLGLARRKSQRRPV